MTATTTIPPTGTPFVLLGAPGIHTPPDGTVAIVSEFGSKWSLTMLSTSHLSDLAEAVARMKRQGVTSAIVTGTAEEIRALMPMFGHTVSIRSTQ